MDDEEKTETNGNGPKDPPETDEADLKMDIAPSGKEPSALGTKGILAILATFLVVAAAAAAIIGLSFVLDDDEDEDDGPIPTTPVITIGFESAGFVDEAFSFTVNVTGVDATGATFRWHFGDNGTSTGPSATHTYTLAGEYRVVVNMTLDGSYYEKEVLVNVEPIPVQPGLLPEGDPPIWTLEMNGIASGSDLTIARMVEDEDIVSVFNITLEGMPRSFLTITLAQVLDLSGARFDAYTIDATGDGGFQTNVFRAESVRIAFAEGGEWLEDTDLDTPLMLVAEDGAQVKDLAALDLSPQVLKVDGNGVTTPLDLTYDDLITDFTPVNYTVNDGMEDLRFTGIPIPDLLERAGLLRNATAAKVRAYDGYVLDLTVEDLMVNPESPDPIFLAFAFEGTLNDISHGPYRLIAPDADFTEDDGHNWFRQSWVKHVVRITILSSDDPAPPLPWGSPVEGTLNVTWDGGFRLFTSGELSSEEMWEELIEMDAIMVKSTGAMVNGTYTGIPVLRLLEIAGAPAWAGNLTFKASDGFSRAVDPMYIHLKEDEEGIVTMVALTENGDWLDEEAGPFRLVSSALSSKYWISGLAEISADEWTLDVNGTVLTMSEILALSMVNITVESKGNMLEYSGFDLLALMGSLGYNVTNGTFLAYGYDYSDGEVLPTGYWQELNLSWFAGNESAHPIVAYRLGGVQMGYSDKGPIRLIVPGQASKFWIGSLTRIEVRG